MTTLPNPVLLVHGIWDDASTFDVMERHLKEAGAHVSSISMQPNDGSAPIAELAEQLDAAASALLEAGRSDTLDIVGFSMGALVSRYWIQRARGRVLTRRFVSISGPHHGTRTAYFMRKAGVKDMRPGSPLLESLAQDDDPFGEVEVAVFYTPFDLMIVPPRSSKLPHAHLEQRFRVPLHGMMITHKRVLHALVDVLTADQLAPG